MIHILTSIHAHPEQLLLWSASPEDFNILIYRKELKKQKCKMYN